MSTAFNLAMAMLCKEQEPEPYQATKLASVKSSKVNDSTPIAKGKSKSPPFTFIMADGKVDATAFLLSLREAGKRTKINHLGISVECFDPSEARNDTIKAIGAYCGYDFNGDFGTQETMARAQAMRERNGLDLSKGLTRQETRRVQASAMGYVHGMPDGTKKTIENLLRREVLVAEARDKAEEAWGLAGFTEADWRDCEAAMAGTTVDFRTDALAVYSAIRLERDRLAEIQKDLKSYGY